MDETRVSSYRWVVLILYMLVNISAQILWISYAPVTLDSVAYYGVNEFEILFMSTVIMIVYIPVSFIASWFVNRYGFRIGVGIGALMNGAFGFLRFTVGSNYIAALTFQIMIGISQPIILNSLTLLSANWFPDSERTTATGLSFISGLSGVALGMVLTPIIVLISNISTMLFIYGLFSLIVGILFMILAKEGSKTISLIKNEVKTTFKEELKLLFSNKLFWIVIVLFIISLGIFNMVTTYIELIVTPRGLSSVDAGVLGGMILLGGIIGTIILSPLSDKLNTRKPFIIASSLLTCISMFIIAFAYNILLFNIFGFLLGVGLMAAGPIVLEYATEITDPVPEVSSNGILMVVGQISGIMFIIGLERLTTPSGDYFPSLILLSILTFLALILTLFIKEVKK